MALRYPHGHRLGSRPWASMWPLVATWAIDINIDSGYLRTVNHAIVPDSSLGPYVTMAPDGNAGHLYQNGPHSSLALRYQHGPKW